MNKTEKLKHIILSKYNSVREFSKIVEIPSTTLTSALDKGIGGMAVDRIIKICDVLNIDIKTFEPIENTTHINELSKEETTLLENYNKLNSKGKEKLIEYSDDLTTNIKYIDNEISATNEITYDNFETVAAHNDELTVEEIAEADRRILEDLNKRNKK